SNDPLIFIFFSSRRRHTRSKRDWSSDVCSSDLKGVQIAKEQIESYRAWKSPTVDLVGRAAYEKLDGSGRYGDAINKADEWMVGVQLNVPIFTGGYRCHKRVAATHQNEKSLAENDSIRQVISQQKPSD